jgi:glutathione synthase/RimK-type ligase-like ATP-grasp enzyme
MVRNNTTDIIGASTFVDFPKFGLKNIPAKVDTGADSSSIWASSITNKNGVLEFCLFDKRSRYYTGNVITTRDYSFMQIRNSIDSEFRYKVRLQVAIHGRLIKATFTLADRSNIRYPVLIGARTLRGKFLVDVSRKIGKKKYDVLVLTSKDPKWFSRFVVNAKEKPFHLEKTNNKIFLASAGRSLDSFDMVFFKDYLKDEEVAVSAASFLHSRGVVIVDEALAHITLPNKLYQYVVMTDNEIPIPKTIFISTPRLRESYDSLTDKLGLPFVLKNIRDNKGRNNFLVTSSKHFKSVLDTIEPTDKYISQELIENNGDYRLLIMDKKIKLVIGRRRTSSKTHLNNVSAGSEARVVDFKDIPSRVQKFSLQAAAHLKRDIAGVDVVQNIESGLWYCFEVNDGPQLTSGVFVGKKREAFFDFITTRLTK